MAEQQPSVPLPPAPWTPGQTTTLAPAVEPVRSGVKIETTAKGMATLKVQVYENTTEEEMQRLKDLAIRTYEVGLRELANVATIAQ